MIAFVAGYLREDLALTLYIFLAFAVVCLGVCRIPYPALRPSVADVQPVPCRLAAVLVDLLISPARRARFRLP